MRYRGKKRKNEMMEGEGIKFLKDRKQEFRINLKKKKKTALQILEKKNSQRIIRSKHLLIRNISDVCSEFKWSERESEKRRKETEECKERERERKIKKKDKNYLRISGE